MLVLFWISVSFLAYTYIVYPFIICAWGAGFPRRVRKRYEGLPVSVVVAARNEQRNIEDRVHNLLAQDYPADLIEVIIVSDGSTDRTAELALEIGDPRVRVIETGEPVGKAWALNLGVANASNHIVVFADARQRFSENAIAEMVALFHDEQVGAVTGELVIRKNGESDVSEGVGLYWAYEKLIRRMESRADSVVGSTGCIYAIRRHLFVELPANTLLDDVLVPMRIVLAGYRVVFSRAAKAFDWASTNTSQEFARKVRTLAGNFQAFSFEKSLLNPFRNRIFFQMISHKVTRLLAPYFVLLALVSNLFLTGLFFKVTILLQALFYLTVLLRFTPLTTAPFGGIIRVAWTFVVLNAAAVAGLWVFISGRDQTAWKNTHTGNGVSGAGVR
jgi:cellulose synthase/poly-beta-1,6-N-acetylglucosamine synthase-like glycosyltransferase